MTARLTDATDGLVSMPDHPITDAHLREFARVIDLDAAERARCATDALEALDHAQETWVAVRDRAVFEMRAGGLEYADIASTLGASRPRAQQLFQRAAKTQNISAQIIAKAKRRAKRLD